MTAITPPAAPAQSAPPAAIAAPPEPAAPASAAPSTPDAATPPRAPDGRFTIAPIKLPGVARRTQAGHKTLAQELDAMRAADEPPSDAPAEPAPDGAAPDPNAPPAAEPPAKIKFDGREFASQEEVTAYAETQLRTARNAQAAAARNAQLQANRAKQETEAQYAARLAALEQRILQPQTPDPAQADPSEQQFWAEVLQARQSASLIQDPAARAREEMLIQYAVNNFMLDKRLSDLQAKIDARFQPFEMTQAQSQQLAASETLFESVAQYRGQDSSPQFPELHNEVDADGVVQIWHNQTRGMKVEDRMDPRQVVLAVLAYRALKAELTKGQPQAPKPALPPQPPPPPPARPAASGAVLQQSNLNGAPRSSLPGGQVLPGVWSRSKR